MMGFLCSVFILQVFYIKIGKQILIFERFDLWLNK